MTESLHSLPLRQKVGQLFCIGIAGPQIDDATRTLLDEVSPGGVCLFARNVRERFQTRELTDAIRGLLPIEPIIAIDQEGGLVDRLRRIMTPMPAANTLRNSADSAHLAELISETLLTLGVNVDFAPVVDVIDEERAKHTNGLFSREFGRSKEDVVSLAGSFLNKLQTGGIVGCLKHFPGLGAATVDSHEELPQVAITEEEFRSTDLFPYFELFRTGKVHSVMVAHAAFPNLNLQETDKNGKLLPSSLSSTFITGLLRGELGFDGLVITDDLEMGAIVRNYGIGDACVMALDAGADMLAICADPEKIREGYQAVLDAVESGAISEKRFEAALSRIASLKANLSPALPFDNDLLDRLSAATAEFNGSLDRK